MTVAPLLAGGDVGADDHRAVGRGGHAPMRLARLVEDEGTLLLRYVRAD